MGSPLGEAAVSRIEVSERSTIPEEFTSSFSIPGSPRRYSSYVRSTPVRPCLLAPRACPSGRRALQSQ